MGPSEGYVNVPGGKVWYRRVGSGRVPLLRLHGGPGFTHHYLEALEQFASDREVIFYDQLGCGESDRPADASLWTVSRWSRECAELLADLSPQAQHVIREHERSGYTDCPEYQGAILGFYRRHVCRMTPWPEGLERSFAHVGLDVYHRMNGPSEFTVTGTLKDWDVTNLLGQIRVPTLLVGGEYDECRPAHLADMAERIPGSQHETIADASHLCFAEQPQAFGQVLRAFLDRTEGSVT